MSRLVDSVEAMKATELDYASWHPDCQRELARAAIEAVRAHDLVGAWPYWRYIALYGCAVGKRSMTEGRGAIAKHFALLSDAERFILSLGANTNPRS